MTIDRALSGNPFGIDRFRCRDAANSLAGFRPQSHVGAWTPLPTLSQLIFKSLFVSICHQINWDFLQNAMAEWLLPNPEQRLEELSDVRAPDVSRVLSAYSRPERVRAVKRARMLRTTARELKTLRDSGRLGALLANPRLEGSSGFYDVMRSISAFAEDELEKKIRVLAHDLHREAILVFLDPQNLRPAIEYHILRLYLRSGRVYPTHESVRQQLCSPGAASRTRLVKLLRQTVEEAMELTAFYANVDVANLNYVEWQIARSICIPEMPKCIDPPSDDLADDVAAISILGCPYAGFCRSYTEPQYGWYHEPHFQKAIY